MKDSPATILLIEDERQMRRFLRVTLQSEKYGVLEAETAKDGLSQAATRNPDIVLLDLGLPDMDGLEVIEKLREWSTVPVIVISAREQEGDKIKALDRGADDYLTKPFGAGELLARIRVALRHAAPKSKDQGEAVFVAEELKIDFLKRQVYCGTREIHLTPIEYRLLTVLVRDAGRVMTHRQFSKKSGDLPTSNRHTTCASS
jgi:two-component system KDP operon response regulator KdpE